MWSLLCVCGFARQSSSEGAILNSRDFHARTGSSSSDHVMSLWYDNPKPLDGDCYDDAQAVNAEESADDEE